MSSLKLTGKDFLLLLLYSPGVGEVVNEPISGRTRIVKMVFLFQKEIYPKFKFDIDALIDFKPWNFGPWSEEIYENIEFFKSIGFIMTRTENINTSDLSSEEAEEFEKWEENFSLTDYLTEEYQLEVFVLSPLGEQYIKDEGLFGSLSENQKLGLREFKKKFNGISLFSLLRYVYKKYPEMIKHSDIKGKILSQNDA